MPLPGFVGSGAGVNKDSEGPHAPAGICWEVVRASMAPIPDGSGKAPASGSKGD